MTTTMTTTIATTTKAQPAEDRTQAAPMRHEMKHQISPAEDLVLSRRLRQLFAHDNYAGEDGTYLVTSLYFDTPYDDAVREKLAGVSRREKFRLRYYGEDTSFIRLEKKFKHNGLCGKRSARLSAAQAQELIEGEYDFLLESKDPLLAEFYSKLRGKALRPKTIVRYSREAFLYEPGNVRITLDRNLASGLGSVNFLQPDTFYMRASEPLTILEIKYDAFLPEIVRMAVQVPHRQAQACSKYVICRRFD